MKKSIFVFAFVVLGSLFCACEQEDISPSDELEIQDLNMTDGGEDEEVGDRPKASSAS
ncbi:MAG: hypothetical protein ABJG47_06150 [Ekhidna sp.]